MGQAPARTTNQHLGYPADARLLLVNADDFGMYPGVNAAVVRAFDEGIVRSTSLMAPLPGAAEAMELVRQHPEIRFGIHLSIVRDIPTYYWDPLAPKERIPSLLDTDGNFYAYGRMKQMLDTARVDELAIEFRAQIEAVLAAGLTPTHLDWHCLYDGGRADIFALCLGLAREYGLALRVGTPRHIAEVQRQGLPTNDHPMLDSFSLDLETKAARYAEMLRALPPGLTEWAVHPGGNDPESRAIDPDGWRVRHTDFAFLVSPEAQEIIAAEGITLISFEPLQRVWRAAAT